MNDWPLPRPYAHLPGEALRRRLRAADSALARELARLRAHDPKFRAALDLAVDLQDETDHRRNTP